MIAGPLLAWFDRHGRHDLPWQHPRTPYRVWLAEIMLQQTQVTTVLPYFRRFTETLPTLPDLAAASEDQVLALWSGLGYYRRARHLHAAARQCVAEHAGQLPTDIDALLALPGIGQSTAGAILAQAHNTRHAILDGNVKRVLTRYHGVHGHPDRSQVNRQLWQLAWQYTPETRVADYTQAIMDLGASVCTRRTPDCPGCPLQADCVAYRDDLIDRLPERKPARKSPLKHTTMLLLVDESDRVLLEKRGLHGVWAGLWSLPETDAEAATTAASRLARIDTGRELAAFTHVFSHYQLHVTPVLFAASPEAGHISDNDQHYWCQRHELGSLGLPAPVRKLLDATLPPT